MLIIKHDDDNVDDDEKVVWKHLEKIKDNQRQSASLFQEEYVDNQPDGEEEEGKTEDDKRQFFTKRANFILIRTATWTRRQTW